MGSAVITASVLVFEGHMAQRWSTAATFSLDTDLHAGVITTLARYRAKLLETKRWTHKPRSLAYKNTTVKLLCVHAWFTEDVLYVGTRERWQGALTGCHFPKRDNSTPGTLRNPQTSKQVWRWEGVKEHKSERSLGPDDA